MSRKLIAWTRISSSVILIAMGSYCALQALVAGMAYGDMYGIKELVRNATLTRNRGYEYLLACILIQILSGVILAPLFLFWTDDESRSVIPQGAVQYVLALATSFAVTCVAVVLLVWILRTFKLA